MMEQEIREPSVEEIDELIRCVEQDRVYETMRRREINLMALRFLRLALHGVFSEQHEAM